MMKAAVVLVNQKLRSRDLNATGIVISFCKGGLQVGSSLIFVETIIVDKMRPQTMTNIKVRLKNLR